MSDNKTLRYTVEEFDFMRMWTGLPLETEKKGSFNIARENNSEPSRN
jgi:hypothetical protein